VFIEMGLTANLLRALEEADDTGIGRRRARDIWNTDQAILGVAAGAVRRRMTSLTKALEGKDVNMQVV
jgi:hypothetical protein